MLRSPILLSMFIMLSSSSAFAQASTESRLTVDFSGYDPGCGILVQEENGTLTLRWPTEKRQWGHLALSLEKGRNLIRYLALSEEPGGRRDVLLQDVEPVTLVTVGERDLKKRNGWVIFFDKTHLRPYRTFRAGLELECVRITSQNRRVTVSIGTLSAGPFRGELLFTVYAGSRLVHVEAAVSSEEDARAIVYDAGLSGESASWNRLGWMATDGRVHRVEVGGLEPAKTLAVRHRTIVAESDAGSVAVFPPPHQYFYPLDFSDNLKFVWYGRGFRELEEEFGLGIRHRLEGDKRFVPWFNAPPGTRQKLAVFYLLSAGRSEDALREVKRYTNGDRFRKLAGHVTFASHFHVEHTTDFVRRLGADFKGDPNGARVPPDLERPAFVEVFKEMGVDIAHLAEFHFGRTPRLKAEERLPLLELMHRECERLSDEGFLLLPGEEPNVHLGGHWISFFPRPVYWVLHRGAGVPFVQSHPKYGTVYHVGSAADVLNLLKRENGLAWTAHPRIKSSTGYPDRYREESFFHSDRFLGAAWKAMPADLSLPRLGVRVLDLLDDMANWGHKKYVLGEVDVFKIRHDHEQYGHMNVNYLRLDDLPRYSEGWQPVHDALRGGKFFVTTGEVLLPRFAVGGKLSGETLDLAKSGRSEIEVVVAWTFPLAFAEIVSGDGRVLPPPRSPPKGGTVLPPARSAPRGRTNVYRYHVDLSDTASFGERTLRLNVDLTGRTWVRVEVWDVAANGAFSQPVWLSN